MLEGDHSGMERLAFEGGDGGGCIVGEYPPGTRLAHKAGRLPKDARVSSYAP